MNGYRLTDPPTSSASDDHGFVFSANKEFRMASSAEAICAKRELYIGTNKTVDDLFLKEVQTIEQSLDFVKEGL